MINPNPYDDREFTEASNDVQSMLPGDLNRLWKAGASLDDIANEFAMAIENSDIGVRVRVEISER